MTRAIPFKSDVFQLSLTASLIMAPVGVFGQGLVVFNNRVLQGLGPGTPAQAVYQPIFGINPANPTEVLNGAPNAPTVGGNPLPNFGTANYSGRALLAGTGFTAQLWYGAVGSYQVGLVPANNATSTFRTGATTVGAFTGLTATLDNPLLMIPGGEGNRAVFQVRAWDNLGGTLTTWAGVLANPGAARGESILFSPPFDLGSNTYIPPTLIGMESFGLFVVPEPSLIALGALGLGGLLLRHRRASAMPLN